MKKAFGDWYRVDRRHRCPVCGKPDWCLVRGDGSVALCQRIESDRRCGEAGWLHRLKADMEPRRIVRRQPRVERRRGDWRSFWSSLARRSGLETLWRVVRRLGVRLEAAEILGCRTDGAALYTPMYDRFGRVCGVHIRRGRRKLCLRGSTLGLFVPSWRPPEDEPVLVCEGESDTLSALSLGFCAVGRPSCTACVDLCASVLRKRHVVVVADNDEPGLHGGTILAQRLACTCPSVRLFVPPRGKDLRDAVTAGMTRGALAAVLDELPVWDRRGARLNGGR